MSNVQRSRINLSAPNLINICVDAKNDGEISGRMYHCYQISPVPFQNVVELIRAAEQLFDRIGFPQASTKTRTLAEKAEEGGVRLNRPERIVSQEAVAEHRGELGTFITSVRLRQNATWQGDFYWVEHQVKQQFSNTLEFIKQIDMAIL